MSARCTWTEGYNATTNFTNGNWPNFNQDQVALDAHWGAEDVLDYWRIVQNRNSIDGNGIRVLGYVHAGVNWNNAQWVGGTNNHFMQYGDGDNFTFHPLIALDVCAHEMGHGITEFTCNLNPGTQESGALNEGFSDIWGASIEHWAAPNKQTWLMGEEIMANGADCLRNMEDPNDLNAGEGRHPDTYHGNFWDNGGEPHTNSTVLSHWFFLLSEGGNGTNDIGNAFTVNGIGIDDAQRIAYRTESVYLNSSANYTDARNACLQAARDLFGAGSCEEIAATNAWYAVGVGNAYTDPSLSVNGDNIVCTTSNNYTITNLPAGATVQWQLSQTGIATINSPTGLQTTLTRNGNGVINLTATITYCAGQVSISKQNIIVGSPTAYTLTPSYSTQGYSNWLQDINCLKTYTFPGMYSGDISLSDPVATSFAWTYVSKYPSTATVNISYSDPRYATVTVKPSGARVTYRLTTSNSCGSYSHDYTFVANGICGIESMSSETSMDFSISPNPAQEYVTVSVVNTASSQNLIYGIKINDASRVLRSSYEYKSGVYSTRISLAGLTTGLYFVSVFDGQNWNSKQLLIEK